MSRIVRYLNERVTALDLNLLQRFGRRELGRALTGLSVVRGLGPRGSTVGDSQDRSPMAGRNLRGLEVTWTAGIGWNALVSAGAMLLAWTGVDETRPGTWSGKLEPDDATFTSGVLPAGVQVAPASTPGGALTQYEYWIVYATVSEATIETDSARKVFNYLTGLFDAASAAKVKQHKLTVAVLRGSGNSPPPFSGLPGGAIALALLYVPVGATDLSGAVIFDCRRFLVPGGNRVGGCWQFSHEGQITSPYGQTIFQGRVHAQLGGEQLGARVYPSVLTVGDLAEPGATWDAAATPSTPKIAWLYLARPGGYVPRPVRRGQYPLGHHPSYLAESVILDGTLVLSPTPPRIGASTTAADASKSGLRWDLRPSASLTLPGFHKGDLPYQYSGLTVTADNAICVGFYRYTGVDSGTPKLQGSLHVDEQGWMRGSSIASQETNESGLFTVPTFTADNGVTPRTLTSALYGPATLTVAGVTVPLPIDAARLMIELEASNTNDVLDGTREDAGRHWIQNQSNECFAEIERRGVTPGQRYLNEIQFLLNAAATWAPHDGELLAVRFPYGEELVT